VVITPGIFMDGQVFLDKQFPDRSLPDQGGNVTDVVDPLRIQPRPQRQLTGG
jgi:hypothetical protein